MPAKTTLQRSPVKNLPQLDLLTIGDCSIDLFLKMPDDAPMTAEHEHGSYPKMCFMLGSKIPVEQFQTSIAGNSVNVGAGARFLGLNVGVYIETGDDNNADRIKTELEEYGIDTTYFVKNKGRETSLHAVIVYAGDRTIFSYHGKTNYTIKDWPAPKFIYYTSIGDGFQKFQKDLIEYKKKHTEVGLVFNPGTYQMLKGIEALADVIKITDILIVNKEEAVRLTESSVETAIEELTHLLADMGPQIVVLTDGPRGAYAYDGAKDYYEPIYNDPRPTIDATGAGDAFSAGFVSAIIYGKKIQEALKWGAINSASQIKVIGSIKGMLTKNQIEKALQ